MIGNIFPNMELIWRKNNDTKRNDTNVWARTHPPGVCTPTREDAAEPPRPDNVGKRKQHFFLEWKMKETW